MANNSRYKVSCEVANYDDEDNVIFGYVEKTFNTIEFEEDFNFIVSPSNGTAFYDLFELAVLKPEDEALKCEFGYFNQYGEVKIEDQSRIASTYSSLSQHVTTTLPLSF